MKKIFFAFFLIHYFAAAGQTSKSTPTYVGVGTTATNINGISPQWPASYSIGDIAFCVVETAGGENVPSTPSGWTLADGCPVSAENAATGTTLTIYWKFATSTSEAACTIGDSGDHQVGRIIVFRGANTAGKPYIDYTTGTKTTASTTATGPSITTKTNNNLIIYFIARSTDIGSSQFSGWTNASLTGVTERSDVGGTSNNGGGSGIGVGALATAGTTGTMAATMLASEVNAYLTIGLMPNSTINFLNGKDISLINTINGVTINNCQYISGFKKN
jgi:hypothetical protein